MTNVIEIPLIRNVDNINPVYVFVTKTWLFIVCNKNRYLPNIVSELILELNYTLILFKTSNNNNTRHIKYISNYLIFTSPRKNNYTVLLFYTLHHKCFVKIVCYFRFVLNFIHI